jgi:DNA-binding MarR family transcriptional regulator
MSPAHRFLHAEAGGARLLPAGFPHPRTVTRPTSNLIRKGINASTDLSKGEKRMLSEICCFVVVGKKQVCDAKNAHFVSECLIAKDSVARILARLETKQLVTVDPGKEQGNKRLIWPTRKALALFMTAEQLAELAPAEEAGTLSTFSATPIDVIMQTLSTFVDTPIDFLQGGLSTFSGEAIDFLRASLLIVKEKYLESIGKEEAPGLPSSPVAEVVVEENATQPASPAPVALAPRGPRPGVHDEPADCTTADQTPLLNKPETFKAACLDMDRAAYAGIDFEHYRKEILFDSREANISLPAYRWRIRIRRWLANAAADKAGLRLASSGPLTPTAGVGNLAARTAKQNENEYL